MRHYLIDLTLVPIGVFQSENHIPGNPDAAALLKRVGGRFLGLSAGAWSGVGTALAADALIDFAIQIKKLMDMWDASKEAKDQYCKC